MLPVLTERMSYDPMPMKTKTNGRALAIAARRYAGGRAENRTFASSLLMGLGSASLFMAGEIPAPTIPRGDLRSDWRAVRRDIEVAIQKHGGKKT